MELSGVCDYCGQRKAVHSCEVCGSNVCGRHKKEHGCAVCGGGQKSFD